MEIHVNRGLSLPIHGEPEPSIDAGAEVTRVAFVAADFLSLRHLPRVLVTQGQRVRQGEPLVQSKQCPAVIGTAPGSGVVEQIIRGRRRTLKAITIRLDGDEQQEFPQYDAGKLGELSVDQIRENLLTSGLWLALRTRPYSLTPLPDSEPSSLFVTAIDTQPLAPPPGEIIAQAADAFVQGLQIVSRLCKGKTFLCAAPDTVLPAACDTLCTVARFSGKHPAGLVGTHIHYLSPAGEDRMVWTINYQDVMAIGRLFTSGRLPTERIVALGGPLVARPRLLKTRVGASLEDLLAGELTNENEPQAEQPPSHSTRVLSGSVLAGRRARDWAAYLGWFHHQVSVIRENSHREFLGWMAPGGDKFSALRAFVSHLRPGRAGFNMDANYHGSPRALMPIGVYERVMPLDLLITPLLRALLVGDIEAAIELGCLELDEEDLALCSFVCPGKHDFGGALRDLLDRIHKEYQT